MKLIEFPRLLSRRKNKLDRFILSSRVRIARNLDGLKFPKLLSNNEIYEVDEKLSNVILNLPNEVAIENFEDLPKDRVMAYISSHIISNKFLETGHKLACEINGDWVILFNEDDHFRIFAIEQGYNIKNIYSRLDKTVSQIEKKLNFAFDDKWGYLTSSVLNMGSGLRLSVVANLYGMMSTKQIENFVNNAGEMGYSVANIANDESTSGLFLIYNIYSLGLPEAEMAKEFDLFITKLYETEMQARNELFAQSDELDLCFEEIIELSNKTHIDWENLLYYVSLIDAMNTRYLNIKNIHNLRSLVVRAKTDYIIHKLSVDKKRAPYYRLDMLKNIISQIKFSGVKI